MDTGRLWRGVGHVCYLSGLLLFASALVGGPVGGPAEALAGVLGDGTLVVVASIVLIVGGRSLSRYGTGSESARSADGEGDPVLVCEECGAENEAAYQFCGECSAELPE